MTSVTLVGKPGCHLCDDARTIVTAVLAEHPDVVFDERSIFDDDDLKERFVEEIPVILINDRVHTIWRVDEARFRRALAGASAD